MIYRAAMGAVAFAAVLAATPAAARDGDRQRRVTVSPYIELSQVAIADLSNGGDVLTYTSAAAGVDASIESRRVTVNASIRYEHQFSYDKRVGDADIVSGLANAQVRLAPGLSLDGGGLATRTRNGLGRGLVSSSYDRADVSNLYSAYVGPTLATGSGPIFVNAAYRFAYTRITTPDQPVFGGPRANYFDDSKYQMATVSTGFKSGTIAPFGATLSAGWTRDDQGQLDNRFDGLYGRGDVVLPVGPTVALQAGVGYEKITSSGRDPVLTGAGVPVVDANGRYVTDTNMPRRIAYRTDGVYWDAGVVWRPSRRTTLEARVGRRYDSWSYTGSLSYAPSNRVGVQVGVYDTVETFGGRLQRGLRGLPEEFTATRDLLTQQFSGCTFGTTGGGASGACLNSVFASISSATYRSRGVDGTVTLASGQSTIGFGAGYSTRKFYARNTPGVTLYGQSDDSYYAQLFYSAPIGPRTNFDANAFYNYYDSGIAGASGINSYGATGSLSHSFGRLSATGSLGVYGFSAEGQDDQATAQASLGARYHF